jgi:uridine kinase
VHGVHPMHVQFVEPSRRYAELIVTEGGFNDKGIGDVLTRIQSLRSD